MKEIHIIVDKEGRLICEWWTPELDELLELLGVPKEHWSRNPWCG